MLALLFTLGLVGTGAIVDAGANEGADTAFLATLQLERLVIAVEPLAANVAAITNRLLPLLPNVRLVHGAWWSVKRARHGLVPRSNGPPPAW